MLIRRTPLYITKMDVRGWQRLPNELIEENEITAYLSDGSTRIEHVTVSYRDMERERIFEKAVFHGEPMKDLTRAIRSRRNRAVESAIAILRRAIGEHRNGV